MINIIDSQNRRVIKVPGEVRPALCLDLDGTVRYSNSGRFINRPEDVEVFDGVEARIWRYRDDGFLVFGVTNQGGVAFGLKTLAGHIAELNAMTAKFRRGNPFHDIKSCYHHPDGKVHPYKYRSLIRKPFYGMLVLCEVSAWELGYVVDWDNSLMVGDRTEDRDCALSAGVSFQWAHEFFDRNPEAHK